MSKKISIITINYNNLEGLKRTVESVVNQTWQEFEYIVIDGGSTDGSAEYIESQNGKIDYWVSEPDNGIYNAMNKGIEKATGEYLLFLNSGDYLFTNKTLKENVKYIKNYDFIFFNIQIVGIKSPYIYSCPNTLIFSDLYFGSLPHQSSFIKKELFQKIGLYDEGLRIVSDWKFFIIALYKYHCTYIKINKTFAAFHSGGISSQFDNLIERDLVLKEYFSEYYQDYNELKKIRSELVENRNILESNRFKMLSEIEKSFIGKKIISILFRIFILFFTKNKIKDFLN
jgi:glycosyltransferase involved in cell wall biosynthesis